MDELDLLLTERATLEAKIERLEREGRAASISRAKEMIRQYGLEPYDLFDEISIKIEPKYADPATGNKWSGRGKTPKWLVGKDR